MIVSVHSYKTISRGYVNDEESTKSTFCQGWLRTGDIAKIDENNNFWITDRLKEVRNFHLQTLKITF